MIDILLHRRIRQQTSRTKTVRLLNKFIMLKHSSFFLFLKTWLLINNFFKFSKISSTFILHYLLNFLRILRLTFTTHNLYLITRKIISLFLQNNLTQQLLFSCFLTTISWPSYRPPIGLIIYFNFKSFCIFFSMRLNLFVCLWRIIK